MAAERPDSSELLAKLGDVWSERARVAKTMILPHHEIITGNEVSILTESIRSEILERANAQGDLKLLIQEAGKKDARNRKREEIFTKIFGKDSIRDLPPNVVNFALDVLQLRQAIDSGKPQEYLWFVRRTEDRLLKPYAQKGDAPASTLSLGADDIAKAIGLLT